MYSTTIPSASYLLHIEGFIEVFTTDVQEIQIGSVTVLGKQNICSLDVFIYIIMVQI